MGSRKQAVVYLLDASASMGSSPFGKDGGSSSSKTRFDCAKEGILQMMGDLMLQSKTNECSLIALQTRRTRHHNHFTSDQDDSGDDEEEGGSGSEIDDETEGDEANIPFPHMTEYPTEGIRRPTVSMLRRLQKIRPRRSGTKPLAGGDFCSGIVLAADALKQRTDKRIWERSIVLWTDVRGYKVVMDVPEMLTVIDSLRSMECRLYVVGMDFETTQTVDYLLPAAAPSSSEVRSSSAEGDARKRSRMDESEEQEDESETADEDEEDDSDGEDDDPNRRVYKTAADRERLLQSLTEKTGGTVLAASTMQQVLQHQHGQRLPSTGTARKLEFCLAPNITLTDTRFSLWASSVGVETFKYEAAQVLSPEEEEENRMTDDKDDDRQLEDSDSNKENGEGALKIRKNALGEEMTEEVTKIVSFVDADDLNTVIPMAETTKALRYGADLIPLSDFDLDGARAAAPRPSKPVLQILGYLPISQIPRAYRQGPSYRIFDLERGSRNDVALRALARALLQRQKVALCTFVKTNNGEPLLGGLFPNDEIDKDGDHHPLVFLRLPYAGDVKELPPHVFDVPKVDQEDRESKVRAAKALIRGLSLGDSKSEPLPLFPQNPFIKAWNQTRLARALDPQADAVFDYVACDMETPRGQLSRATPLLAGFREAFTISSRKDDKAATTNSGAAPRKRATKNSVHNYRDHL